MSHRRFYFDWIGANAVAEAAGLGTTFVIGLQVAPSLDRLSGVVSTLSAMLLAIALGTVLEGVVVGFAQEVVLRRNLDRLRPRSWLTATAAGAALAWTLGMIPSTVASLASADSGSSQAPEPPMLVTLLLAAGLGLVAGPILGLSQWTVLRRHVDHAGRWLWANALAWAVGMPLIFLGMDVVPWGGQPTIVTLSIYAVCGLAGLIVGAIHGRVLRQLIRAR
jgi:hypothetical protein